MIESPSSHRFALAMALFLLVALFVTRVVLAHTLNVNWDEFYFLSRIHSYLRGDLVEPMLTFHVHFLRWIASSNANEVEQVVHLRQVMLLFMLVAAVSAWFIGRRLLGSGIAACLVVFFGQSFSNVMNHGASARFDPPVVAFALLAGALLLADTRRSAFLAAIAFSLGLSVSIKSAFYAPTLLGLIGCRILFASGANARQARSAAFVDALVFVVASALFFVVLSAAHRATLTAALPSGSSAPRTMGAIAEKVLAFHPRIPNLHTLVGTLDQDRWWWVLLALGLAVAGHSIIRGDRRLENARLLCFALPMLALLQYRNAFAYFYVSVVPLASVVIGLPFARVLRAFQARPLTAVGVLALLVAPSVWASTTWVAWNVFPQMGAQRQLVDVVHQTFPRPVPYLDRCSMIGSFPKVGPFMSTWTLGEYRERGEPIMRDLLVTEQPQFLLENVSSLKLSRSLDDMEDDIHRLLPEDIAVLQENFIPHWPRLRVAGKQLPLSDSSPRGMEILIGGVYVIELERELDLVEIDGVTYADGELVTLSIGEHQVRSLSTSVLRLRTATALPPPSAKPVRERFFVGFRYRTPLGMHN